jgi:hypothetical protein
MANANWELDGWGFGFSAVDFGGAQARLTLRMPGSQADTYDGIAAEAERINRYEAERLLSTIQQSATFEAHSKILGQRVYAESALAALRDRKTELEATYRDQLAAGQDATQTEADIAAVATDADKLALRLSTLRDLESQAAARLQAVQAEAVREFGRTNEARAREEFERATHNLIKGMEPRLREFLVAGLRLQQAIGRRPALPVDLPAVG